jgi:hypothetical protein
MEWKMPTSCQFLEMFRVKRFWSHELSNNPDLLYHLMVNEGFQYIRRVERQHFRDIVRNPTVGCMVEVSVTRYPGCISLTSPKALQMLKKVCYF